MGKLTDIGRIFYGAAMAGMGILTVFYSDFPYMFIPPKHGWIPRFVILVFGILIALAGTAIVFKIKARPISLLLGGTLLLMFFIYHIPYELLATSSYTEFGAWENAAKELTLASGAFVIAGCFPGNDTNFLTRFLAKGMPYGAIVFSLTIISYSIDHFLYAKEAADYVPSWMPFHLFWIYFAGIALLVSGIAIILKVNVRLAAGLLGLMILIWFVILHIPRVIVAPVADLEGEIPSALLALAYSGIAFVIAGRAKSVVSATDSRENKLRNVRRIVFHG